MKFTKVTIPISDCCDTIQRVLDWAASNPHGLFPMIAKVREATERNDATNAYIHARRLVFESRNFPVKWLPDCIRDLIAKMDEVDAKTQEKAG